MKKCRFHLKTFDFVQARFKILMQKLSCQLFISFI